MWLELLVALGWTLALISGFLLGQRTSRSTWRTLSTLAETRLIAARALDESTRASLRLLEENQRLVSAMERQASSLDRMDESMGNFARILVQEGLAKGSKDRQVGEAGTDVARSYWQERERHL